MNLSKPVELNSRKQAGKYSSAFQTENTLPKPSDDINSPEVEGLDSVLSLLPRDISSKFCSLNAGVKCSQGDMGGNLKISMTCPRCGTNVNNSHGNCSNCGENAMQCPACRNINYERIDPFQCKECGISRYCKGEISFNLREGVAIQVIDTEDMKKAADEQVDKNLQKAQSSYSSLMKHRQTLQTIACQINEGNEAASPKHLQQLFSSECLSQYNTMMKSLCAIKSLRIEIGKF